MTELAALARVSLCSSDPEDSSDEDTAGEQAQTANTRKYTLCVKYEMHIPFYSTVPVLYVVTSSQATIVPLFWTCSPAIQLWIQL